MPVALRALTFLLALGASSAALAAPDVATLGPQSFQRIRGAANPGGLSTTGWFRIGTTRPFSCDDTFGNRVPATGGVSLGSGNAHVQYYVDLTNLTPNTTYYYCAVAQNSSGKGYGQVHAVKFDGGYYPEVSTNTATDVGVTTATLNANGTPNGTAATGWYRYSSTNPGICHDGFGTKAPFSGISLGSGIWGTGFPQTISGLQSGTTYWYCAIVENAHGIAFGQLRSFTTSAQPPTVATLPASDVASRTAVLHAAGNPKGAPTTGYFRYDTRQPSSCANLQGVRVPASGGIDLGSDNLQVPFSQALTGLMPATTYYYCAYTNNRGGTANGTIASFTTDADAPTVVLGSPVVAIDEVTVAATVNPHGFAATAWLRYDTTDPGTCDDAFGTRVPATGGFDAGAGNAPVDFTQQLTGLTPGADYYYCVVAENSLGTSVSDVGRFRTPAAPTVSTAAVSSIGSNSATLEGLVTPNGLSTSGWFRYDTTHPGTCNNTFGSTTGGISVGAGQDELPLTRAISGLLPGTTYYYCALAGNTLGITYGEVLSFTTDPAPPKVTTSPATSVTGNGATVGGTVVPSGAATIGWVRYDTTHPGICNDSFGVRAPASGGHDLGSGNTSASFTEALANLQPGATYYYCAVAENAAGTSFGAVLSFVVPMAPEVTTLAAGSVHPTSATLQASIDPNFAPTSAWFRYDTVDPGTCSDAFGTRLPATGAISIPAGSNPVNISQAITPTPLTTYYYCAIAENAAGTSFGEVVSFTVSSAPTITTVPAQLVSDTSVVLKSTAHPHGEPTTAWFRYGSNHPGTCDPYYFGDRVPQWDSISLGSGNAPVAFEQTLENLVRGKTYYYCAFASSSQGLTVGPVQSFSMPPDAPTVVTGFVGSISIGSVTFWAETNPHGLETTGWIRYDTVDPGTCDDSFGTRYPATGGIALGDDGDLKSWSARVTGLPTSTTFYYCAISQNALGTSFGNVRSFRTADVPLIADVWAVHSSTVATLYARAGGNGDPGIAWFRYSETDPGTCNDTFGIRAPTTGAQSIGETSYAYQFNQSISGLQEGTTYYFCLIAENGLGRAYSEVKSFTTTETPAVSTAPATEVGGRTAVLHGVANPRGSRGSGWFRYGTHDPGTCSTSWGSRWPQYTSVELGISDQPVAWSSTITGLMPGTTYYYCAGASNEAGSAVGNVESFTTLPLPSVSTGEAMLLTGGNVLLNGTVSPNGSATEAWFRFHTSKPYSCYDGFGTRAPASGGIAVGDGTMPVGFSEQLTGLTPGATYWYCAIAESPVGQVYGALESFVVPAAPTVGTLAATDVDSTSATLQGNANPRNTETRGWFRYDTVHPGSCNDSFGTRAPASGGMDLGSGNSTVGFSQPLTGLIPGTTYYFCAIGENLGGTTFGSVRSFTAPAAPLVTTSAPSSLASTSVTLRGAANPRGADSVGFFRWGTTPTTVCDDGYGARHPSSGGTSLGKGTSETAFTRSLSGLTGGTTYYYCAGATNALGTSYGEVVSFHTPAAPKVTTLAATEVTGSSLTLRGSANPNGQATTAWFRYSETAPSSCNDSFGTRVPAGSGSLEVGDGTVAAEFSAPLTGLVPGRTWYFCALARNAQGLSTGAVLEVTTPEPAQVTTLPVANLTATSVELHGSADPRGNETTGWFRFSAQPMASCDDATGTRVPSVGGVALGDGQGATAFAQSLSSLIPATTYHYCAIAENVGGKSFGAVLTFTTPAAPMVATGSATVHSGTSATLAGTANPNLAATTGWFRYSATDPGACDDEMGQRIPATGGIDLGAGDVAQPFSEMVSGLTPGTTYYWCAIAENAEGMRFGELKSFTTPAAPEVNTLVATGINARGATLNGSANPRLASATGWFRYALTDPGTCDDSFGIRTPASGGVSLGDGESAVPFSQILTSLQPGATYYFCAIAANAEGTSLGVVRSFTTPAAAPLVITEAPSDVTADSATLHATATPNGAEATGWFRLSETAPASCDDAFGTRLPASGGVALGGGIAPVAFTQSVTGLTPGSTWYYCAVAENQAGKSFGQVQTLRTAAPPTVATTPADRVAATSATLNGKATANGAATSVWFRYDTRAPASCDDDFGTRVPAQGIDLGADEFERTFSYPLTGLRSATTYYYCAIAENAAGRSFGELQQFETTARPTVLTGPAVEVTDRSAQLTGSAHPNGAATNAWFRYSPVRPAACDDSFGIRVPRSGGFPLGSGRTEVPFAQTLTDLQPGMTYYFCAIAQNQTGISFGQVVEFQPTALPPLVTTRPAVDVGSRTATLEGLAVLNRSVTTAWFRYDTVDPGACSDTFGTRVPLEGLNLGGFAAEAPFAVTLEGLKPSTSYYFCAIASNLGGAAMGDVRELITADEVPTVQTLSASIEGGVVTLSGAAVPNGLEATASFRYDTGEPARCHVGFGKVLEVEAPLGAGHDEVPFSTQLGGLEPGVYYYCAAATTSAGTGYGSVETFEVTAADIEAGCGCASTSGASAIWLGLLVLGLLVRRRPGRA